ncbi:hypothetical protein [Nocardioides sp. CER19]|uniref:hypothetical protein n=1 Tax=Nocardioides sp. CER19 TaxID=3038538 RepID=UPI0024495149|nr:hypothetical protein [Nocardioides sp. CER19]MDH2416259.1 hypothetical protein [Nocardioides sp. CER19]
MAVSTSAEVPATRADPTPSDLRWRVAAWVAVLVAVAGHVWVARSSIVAGTPSFNYDEIASLMPSRALVGLHAPEVGGAGYFPLNAILAAPIWWFTSSPVAFYRAVLVLGVLLAVVSIWPLARVATRLGLTNAQAVTVAGVVMALPVHTVHAEFATAEKPLFLVVALTALAAVRLAERPTYARVVLVSLGVALAYFAHARMLTVVVAAFLWLVLFTVRHVRVGLVGLAALVFFTWAARTLALRIVLLVSPGGFRQADNFTDALVHLRVGLLTRTVLGQSWEQVVSTFGLAPLGLLVVIVLVLREVRQRSAGPALFLLLAVGALFAGSALDWAQADQLWPTTRVRLDVWIYGRYADPLFALVTLVALAAIVRGARRWEVWAAAAVDLAIVVPTVLWLAPQAPTGDRTTPANMPGSSAFSWALPDHPIPTGILPTLTNDNRFWLIASLVALVPVAVLLVARRRALVVLAVVLVLGAAGTATANVATDDFHDKRVQPVPLVGTLRHIVADHPDTSISYFPGCPGRAPAAGRIRVPWMMLPTTLGTDPGADIVIACAAHPAAKQPGAVALPGVVDRSYRAWVRPGPLQDALRTEGLVS